MKKKIYLVDIMSYIFRAYYGFGSDLTNKEGFPTKAIFGVKNMIRKLLEQEQVEYLVMVFDSARASIRRDIYPLYKANREEAPEDLKKQFKPIFELVGVLNVCAVKKDGYEADDLIAELSRKFFTQVDEVVIVSGDKDLTQLINDKVSMYDGMKNKKYYPEDVKKKYGVYPDQIAEYLALVGDSSDNIPGAKGIGPKTAESLFAEYKDLKGIYKNLDNIRDSVSQKLKNDEEMVKISYKLTRLDHEIPLNFELADFKRKKPKQELLRKFYYNYGFAEDSLLANSSEETQEIKQEIKRHYILLNKKEELQKYITQILAKKYFAFDLETTSLFIQEAEIVGIAIAVEGLPAAYIPIAHKENISQLDFKEVMQLFTPIFQNESLHFIAHNLKYDISVLKNYNISIKNSLEDTMLQSYLLRSDDHQHGLDRLADVFLDHQCISFADIAGSGKEQLRFDEIPIKKAYIYAAEDADVTLQLFHKFSPQIKKKNLQKLYQEIEIPLCLVLLEMERKGVKMDAQLLKKLSLQMQKEAQELAAQIYQEVGQEFNINSPKQLGEILFDKLAITEFKKKTKTGYSTDAQVLEKLAKKYPIAKKINIYRSKQKLINSYLETLPKLIYPKTNRIHTSYHQTIAATGRLSSKDPNLQNIPIRGKDGENIRKAFVAEEGNDLISADYSQIELRFLAHFCQDEKLISAFKEQKDIHSETAASIFHTKQEKVDKQMRAVAKAINFGIIYGMGATKLSQEIDVSRKEASDFIETYFTKYPKIRVFIEQTIAQAKKETVVTTILGRIRNVKAINDKNKMLQAMMERIAVNTRIQGSAADLIKIAMINIFNEYQHKKKENQMILQIHDELVFETPKQETAEVMEIIKRQMENAYLLKVPLQVEVKKGANWQEIH